LFEEAKNDNEHGKSPTRTSFFLKGGKAIKMTAITFVLVGFVAGLFTMAMISLYKYVIKIISR
jgi:hypothetical protein